MRVAGNKPQTAFDRRLYQFGAIRLENSEEDGEFERMRTFSIDPSKACVINRADSFRRRCSTEEALQVSQAQVLLNRFCQICRIPNIQPDQLNIWSLLNLRTLIVSDVYQFSNSFILIQTRRKQGNSAKAISDSSSQYHQPPPVDSNALKQMQNQQTSSSMSQVNLETFVTPPESLSLVNITEALNSGARKYNIAIIGLCGVGTLHS